MFRRRYARLSLNVKKTYGQEVKSDDAPLTFDFPKGTDSQRFGESVPADDHRRVLIHRAVRARKEGSPSFVAPLPQYSASKWRKKKDEKK